MNARILRKWSIHTKNLMSCSVCSLVVVVLLLLVTCAPSLILATMNSRSEDAPFVANPPHMPKNVIRETTTSSSSLTLPSPSALSSLLSLPNRNHRLASGRVEVIRNIGSDREPFPGYYKNLKADDTQHMPKIPGYMSSGSSSGSSSSRGGLMSTRSSSSSRLIFKENVQQQTSSSNDRLGYILNTRGWPRHIPSNPHHSSDNDDDQIKSSSFIDNDGLDSSNDDKGMLRQHIEQHPLLPANPMRSFTNRNFPVQHYNLRRLVDKTQHHVTPSPSLQTPASSPTSTPKQTQQLSQSPALASASTSAVLKQPELIRSSNSKINNKNLKNIFSTTDNKSVPRDNVFDIDISNVNKMKKSSGLPLRFIIESYEVPASLPLARELTEQQRRMLIHEQHLKQLRTMQQQAARSRRDSVRGRYKKFENDLSSSSSSNHAQSFRNSNSHQQQHSFRQQQQQRMRKHSRRYCSARDPAQLAFEAPTVVEGKIVSMTPDRRSNFSATIEVREIYKQQIGSRLQKYLRLQFVYRNNSGECDIYREQLRPRGLVRGDTIEPGRIYLLFLQQIDTGNFTILGQPIRKTKRVVEAVRNAVNENYAQLASIKSISASNRTVENGQELRIVCKVTGRPPPKVTWFKDHRSINRNRKLYQFSHYKKRSELIIRSFNTSDAGRYECRAKNKVNRNIERRAIVIKAYPVVQRFDPNPRGSGNSCPDDASEFCFNGGTCKFFSEIGSYSCICPEGFIGERCDRKEVNNIPPSTYSNEQECGEKKYLGSYYC